MTTTEADRGNWLQTFSGVKFYVRDPSPEDVRIEDIAHALSMICRFGGHVRKSYSVAEHSVRVSECVTELGGSPEEIFWGLMETVALCPSCKIEPAQSFKGFAIMCKRCAEWWRGCDCGGHATGPFTVEHRRGCIIPGPHNQRRKR